MTLLKTAIRKSPYNGPAIVGYNRLEPVPRNSDYRKALRAEVRDALWMLTRQWQMGEFEAEDAGSPIKTGILAEHCPMNFLTTNGSNISFDSSIMPLEMAVEKEKREPDLAFRIESGKLFKQILVKNNDLKVQTAIFFSEFSLLSLQNAGTNTLEAALLSQIFSEPATADLYESLKARAFDGYVLYNKIAIEKSYNTWADQTFDPTVNTSLNESAIEAGQDFTQLYELYYDSPSTVIPKAWNSESLEYNFSLQDQSDPSNATILKANEYHNGSLEWYNFNIDKVSSTQRNPIKKTFIPVPVTYSGMPKSRWWEMEEGTVNFGNINVKTTDLPTLLLIDFALIYGNDWLIIPYPMEVNNLCNIKGILVTDVFGYHTYIPPVSAGTGESWQKWSLFNQTVNNTTGSVQSLFYLTPSLLKSMEQEPVEKISFLRDEMANMVWAYENIIPGAMGKGQKGYEVHMQEANNAAQTTPPNQDSPLRYLLGSDVPFYQIPFIPVEITSDPNHMQMRLQRGTMPEGTNPRGVFLKKTEPHTPFYIREEEVPRSGVNLIRRWQRTRWMNGVTCHWIGREKETGKGEGSSGLEFDQVRY